MSLESENEDDEKMCRVCFGEETSDDEFISPCKCKNDQLFVHKSCFNKWISNDINSQTYVKCPTCTQDYIRKNDCKDEKIIKDKTDLAIGTIETFYILIYAFFSYSLISSKNILGKMMIFIIFFIFLSFLVAIGIDFIVSILIIYFLCSLGENFTIIYGFILGTFLFLSSSFNLFWNEYDKIKIYFKKNLNSSTTSSMYDFHKNIYIDGIM